MAEFDIDSFVNVSELTKQFNALDTRVEQSAEKMSQLIGKMGSLGMGTDYSKIAGDLAAANTKILALEQQVMTQKAQKIKLSVEERTELQALNAVQKLNAIIAAENTTALQKLGAQIKLNIIDSQKYVAAGDTQNKTYLGLIQSTTKLSGEYDRMAKASGANAVKTNSMYGSTFQLTQVMRELPNFAIDARIGFMALSNNLPMLAEGFKSVMLEIDTITGKQKGFSGALKEFGKSLLSLNTVMIVATTIMVLYGDKIVEWVGKIFTAERAIRSITETQKAFSEALSSGSGMSKQNLTYLIELKAAIEKYKKGVGDSDEIVKTYNKTLGVHFGKLDSIEQVMDSFPSKAAEFIKWTVLMQAAQIEAAKASTELLKARNAEFEISTYKKEDVAVVENRIDQMLKYAKLLGANKKDIQEISDKMIKGENGFADFADKLATSMGNSAKAGDRDNPIAKQFIDSYNTYLNTKGANRIAQSIANFRVSNKKSKIFMDSATELFPGDLNTKDPKTSAAQKTFTEINVLRVMYDKQHADLVEKAAQLEQDISKSNLDGELNSYDKRTAAAELYYKIISELSEKDKKIAITNEEAKLESELRANAKKYNDNVAKSGGKNAKSIDTSAKDVSGLKASITSTVAENSKLGIDNLDKSAGQLSVGNDRLEKNAADAILKIIDKFDKEILDAKRKQKRELFTISQDIHADEVYAIQQTQNAKLNALELEASAQKAQTGSKSNFEILGSALGGKTDKSMQELMDTKDTAQKKLEVERNTIRDEMVLKTTSGERMKELWKKLGENEIEQEKLKAKTIQDIELSIAQSQEDLRKTIIEGSIDVLKSLWDSYYQYQQDKIDETLKKQTAANEESVKQYEDETDAGKHTAKELSDYKDRTAAYQASQDEAAAEKKKKLEKEQFLIQQGFALANIWMQYAMSEVEIARASASIVANIPVAGLVLGPSYAATASALALASAIAGSALIAAQTIPAFAEGGTMGKDGKAWVGDGGKNELVMTPTGDWYISPKVPTVVDMKAGTKIFPDINKLDLNSFLAMAQVRPSMLKTDNLEKEIRGLRSDVRNQKQGNFYGMPLIRQLNNSDRYSARRRGLMN